MDKVYHFACGFGIALLTGIILFQLGCTPDFSKGFALPTGFVAGAAKETFDAIRAKSWTVKT